MADRGTTEAAEAPLTRRDIEAKIVALAWQDDEFRRKFIADPKGQFEERLGTRLPDSLKMTAHQETENSLHFVIPAKPRASLDELSDDDLEKIAGGTDLVLLPIAVTVAITALTTMAVASGTGWGK